jgi:PAS domain S-box-containing protein
MTSPDLDRDQLVALLEGVTDAVFTLDGDWRITYVNRAARERIGRSADELLGRHAADVLPRVEGASFAAAYERALTTGVPVREEAWVPAFAGWYEVNAFPAGPSLAVVFRETTGRDLRLGEAQRSSLAGIVVGEPLEATGEALARAVEERFPGTVAALYRYDPDADVLHLLAAPSYPEAWREAAATLRVGPDEGACGRAAHARQPVVLDDLAGVDDAGHAAAAAREHGVVADWAEPVVGADGELLGALGVCRRAAAEPSETERRVVADLAQLAGIAMLRERSDRLLADSERRFRLLARATSDGVYDWDLRGGEVLRSEGYVTLFGEPSDGLGSELDSWTERIHEDDRARVVAGVREALDGDDDTWQDSYRIARADGTIAHVIDRGTLIRDDDGAVVRVIGSITDDSDRFELEQQYLRAQRLESIGTLAGGIAHDLNNVLAPVLMATDLLALDDLTADQQEVVETIASSAKRGAGLVRQVLTFARGVSAERRPVDPRELLADVERMARDTFPKSIEVEVSCPDQLDLIAGDAVQLQQVLINMAVNARDAMPEGGCLRLTAAAVEVDEAYAGMVPGARAGRYVRIDVQDDGTGMDDPVLERLFEPFFTTKAPGRGTGLGMSTSHAIVVAHLGFLEVDTEVGRGTTFRVHLPVAAGAVASLRASDAGGTPRGEGQLVLVVDDERSVRTITRQTLEAAGYRVVTAEDGARAVAVYAEHREEVALVITDVMMPVMDGAAAINALRRIDPEVRVIAVSGLTTHLRGLGAPAPFLAKPFTTEALLRAVDAELGVARDAGAPRRD